MALHFWKYHGLGNDFVVVDGPLMEPERARRVCDRRRGVGADGLLTVLPARGPGAVARMHLYNSDGSVAEMSGNGIRCFARHLAETRGATGEIGIETDAGPKRCTIERGAAGEVLAISVEMGAARVDGEQVFEVAGERLRAVRVDMGNPHAVLLDEPTVERATAVGPPIEAAVPRGVNVGFARLGPSGIDLVVWERGAGLTGACGTGACAAAVVAVTRGEARAGAAIEVRQPGGALAVTVSGDLRRVVLRGPAARVLTGEADL